MTVRIIVGDVREKLAELPDESVHCVVTSPPCRPGSRRTLVPVHGVDDPSSTDAYGAPGRYGC